MWKTPEIHKFQGFQSLVVNFRISLFWVNQLHFLDKVRSPCELIDYKEDVTDIHHDISADRRIIIQIAHSAFPNPVEIEPD